MGGESCVYASEPVTVLAETLLPSRYIPTGLGYGRSARVVGSSILQTMAGQPQHRAA